MKAAPLIGLLIVGLIFTLVAVLFPQAMYAADYAVDSGNASESTNTTLTVSSTESLWFWGMGILVFIVTLGLILWKFFIK